MKTISLNHEARSIGGAFGVSDERKSEIEATIFYEIIDSMMLVQSLFDDVDEAPVNLRAKSGWVEKVLDQMQTEEERLYSMWETCKIDHLTDNDEKAKMFLALMSMQYKMVNGDRDKFIKLFVKSKNEGQNNDDK